MEDLKKKLNIDDTFTKPPIKDKKFTKISDVMTLIEDYNMMVDLLYLKTTKQGNKYLFVITDLATREFDFEAIKNKKSTTVLEAMKTIFRRKKWINKPLASIRSDNGPEFQEQFNKYLKDNNIFHSVSMPYRHTQLSAVESLNKQIGYLLNGYMNNIEFATKKEFKEWDDDKILNLIKKELNKIRYRKAPYTEKNIFNYKDKKTLNLKDTPKYKVDDIVHYQLSYPEDALGNKQPTEKFRVGDFRFSPIPKRIVQVLYYNGNIPYRYMLKDMQFVSFTENQLMKSKEKEQKYKVKRIIGKKKEKKITYYLIWWNGYLKKDSTWEPENMLIKDGLKEQIDDYNSNN